MLKSAQRYISSELAHFVGRNQNQHEQYDTLVKIINSGWLTHPPHNPMIEGNIHIKLGEKLSNNEMYNPQVVCFCDIPLADLSLHISKYSRYGLSFSKNFIALNGGGTCFLCSGNSSNKN